MKAEDRVRDTADDALTFVQSHAGGEMTPVQLLRKAADVLEMLGGGVPAPKAEANVEEVTDEGRAEPDPLRDAVSGLTARVDTLTARVERTTCDPRSVLR
jgi:hypothetical protein